MGVFSNLAGTISNVFRIGLDGPFLKDAGFALEVRKPDDSGLEVLRVGSAASNDDALSLGAHETVDTLAHSIVESSFEEFTYAGAFVSTAIVWTDAGKTTKIRETQYTYSGAFVSQTIEIQYDGAGVELYRVTSVYAYTGANVTSITRTRA